ncbi:MAG: hypothetical protein LBG21_07515 [Campylobacteraceae bacterium]|nr:hypothetical protein [Campylobacteraceae bacterium]
MAATIYRYQIVSYATKTMKDKTPHNQLNSALIRAQIQPHIFLALASVHLSKVIKTRF